MSLSDLAIAADAASPSKGSTQSDPIYTRVIKDAFHAFHMIQIPKTHGLRRPFLIRMREILFQWDPVIFPAVSKKCQEILGVPIEKMISRKFSWVTKRVPRRIGPPSVIFKPLEKLFTDFRNLRDAKTQKPLLDKKAWKSSMSVLNLAKMGFLSDVPDEEAGVDKLGFQKYRCLRGTNKVEGGPHADIYRKFAPFHCK